MNCMSTDDSLIEGLSIRLVPDPDELGAWFVVFLNDGPATVRNVTLTVLEGGIPTIGDLGSSKIFSKQLDQFAPNDEVRFGSFRFVPGGEYLGLPLSANLILPGLETLTLRVETTDFDRLESIRAVSGGNK